MPAQRIRADYGQLAQVAKRFQQQSDEVGQMRRRVQRQMERLQSGDWIGKGAKAFYNEMETDILPRLGRLTSALANAAQGTNKILKIMKQAEGDAAKILGGQGVGAGAAGQGAGVSGAGAQGAGAGASSAGGSSSNGGGVPQTLEGLGEAAYKEVSKANTLFGAAKLLARDAGELPGWMESPVLGVAGKALGVVGAGVDIYHFAEHPDIFNGTDATVSTSGAIAGLVGTEGVEFGAAVGTLGSEAIAPVVAAGATGYGIGRLIAPYTIGPIVDAINKPDTHIDMNDFTADK